MFNFHKPKVYRSSTGCCICKAKSSSSRFTDSKKYEDDFLECFQLQERRTGEICNACVLLVKRWKKLPAGSNRNWRHVVDARAGPGIKSLTKYKSRNKKKVKDKPEKSEKIVKKKHVYLKTEADREHSPAMSDDLTEYYSVAETDCKGSSRSESPTDSDGIAEKQLDVPPAENMEVVEQDHVNDFIDLSYFKREVICCGIIFKGPYGEVIVDPSLLKPCVGCLAARRQRQHGSDGSSSASEATSPIHSASVSPAHSVELPPEASVVSSKQNVKTTFCDSSSDSGYDECSNQGADNGNKTGKHGQDIKLLQRMDQMSYKSLTVDTDVSINPPPQIQPMSSN